MNCIFPSTVKHLPNDDQIRLLNAATYKQKIPGFLHTNALKVSINKKDKNGYYNYIMADSSFLELLKGAEYLFIPFDKPKSYILDNLSTVVGMIISDKLITYWFENPISLCEIYTAEANQIPIVAPFVNIGQSELCSMCRGVGAVDWVDDMIVSEKYHMVPRKRFIIATHLYMNFLIDNQWIADYDGDDIICPCPRCLGLGCDSVLRMVDKKIESIAFDDNPMGYRLLVRDARTTLIETPYCFATP